MNRSEKAIEMVMAGLRDADAPAEMDRRILEAVEQRASSQLGSIARGWRLPTLLSPAASHETRQWAWGVALACIVTVSAATTAVYLHGHFSAGPKAGFVASGSRPQAKRGSTEQGPNPLKTNSSAPIRASHQGASTSAKLAMRRARPISSADGRMLAEMRAASHPAPDAPLTQQEELLVRIVHSGDPQQMAMLNPEIRARQEAESEAEFQKFVDQSIKGDRE